MKTLNKALVIGHVGQDPVLRETGDGKTFLPVSVATHVVVTPSEGEKKQYTEWHNVMLWERNAELAAGMLKKGTQVFIEGRLQTYKKHDATNGIDRYNTVIVGQNFIVLSKKDETVTPEDVASAAAATDDDLPF